MWSELLEIHPLIYVFLISIMPVGELRAGIPIGIAAGYPPALVMAWSTLANILAIPFIFMFLNSAHHFFMRIWIYQKLFVAFDRKIRRKALKHFKRGKFLGLLLFVAIPLPGSGVWSGVIASWLFKLNERKSMAVIMVGAVVSGLIVLGASMGIFSVIRAFV